MLIIQLKDVVVRRTLACFFRYWRALQKFGVLETNCSSPACICNTNKCVSTELGHNNGGRWRSIGTDVWRVLSARGLSKHPCVSRRSFTTERASCRVPSQKGSRHKRYHPSAFLRSPCPPIRTQDWTAYPSTNILLL